MKMNCYSDEELLEVVAARVKKYTSNESTSVTYQTARQLMSSIIYCMQEVKEEGVVTLDKENNHTIYNKNISAMDTFQIGLKQKKLKIEKAKRLYEILKDSFCSYYNECYQATVIEGMKGFFERYDVEFDATNHILTLDYPLISEIEQLQGIDLIYEYLYRSSLEQSFIKRFSEEDIVKLMLSYHQDYSQLIINVAKIVLRNACGCLLAGKSINSLSIEEKDRLEIEKVCRNKSLEEIKQLLIQILEKLIQEEFKGDITLFEYLKSDMDEFVYELKHSMEYQCLEHLLIEVKEIESKNEQVFEEGSSMEDEALRQLIEEMRSQCIEDRIELVKNKVRSLSDLKEILLECFYQEECDRVFALLSCEERKFLIEEIQLKLDFDEELYDWEERLTQY